jgi:sulfate adenylyltransferase subunit 2
MGKIVMNHLRELESESIHVIREVAAQFERPALLFSGGKDSIVMFHLALKAFHPAKVPFPLLHIDTGHNFQETLDFRDQFGQTNRHRADREIRSGLHRSRAKQ